MMNNIFNKFPTSEELANNLAKKVAKILEDSIKMQGEATLLVSGGNTPKLFFQKLSQTTIPWEKVSIGLVDERWIESSLKDSNSFLIRNNLLINYAKKAKFIDMYLEQVNINLAEKICSKVYEREFSKIDVLILGMGADAHTASLFPLNEKLNKAFNLEYENFCISIEPKTAPYKRMSLTLRSILSAENIILHIEGEEKLKVYDTALKSDDIYKYPISSVLKQNKKNIEVFYS